MYNIVIGISYLRTNCIKSIANCGVCVISGESYQCAFYGGARDTCVLECAREC